MNARFLLMSQSVERFSSRVENYVKYRPSYPHEIVTLFETECDLTTASIIADIGSGTGKLAEVFLERGHNVVGVEPNAGMREAAEKILSSYSNFKSVNGTAEATTLESNSVDLVTAGQAFHWFNPELFRTEVLRILKPGGWTSLIWNDRKLTTTAFLEDYEALLLKYNTDYNEVRHSNAEALIKDFYSPTEFSLKVFPNQQVFDFDGLRGRVLSSSYTPEPDSPKFQPMMEELKQAFGRHQLDGQVIFEYDTKVFYGQTGFG
jgi:ubiquinone/menaquinone biosynthesis C-methylase UbiE